MRILVLAPHADDEVIGCGGTLSKKATQGDEVFVCIATNGKPPLFDDRLAQANGWPHNNYLETRESNSILGIKETFYLDFPAARLESVERYELNGRLIELMKDLKPQELFIPHVGDMQKDHQLLAEAAMVAVRPKYDFSPSKVYAYETLSETGWNIPNMQNEFIPNAYVDITHFLEKKLAAMNCYQSQLGDYPDARSLEAIKALAKYRGATMNLMAAEAFMILREIR